MKQKLYLLVDQKLKTRFETKVICFESFFNFIDKSFVGGSKKKTRFEAKLFVLRGFLISLINICWRIKKLKTILYYTNRQ